MCVSLRVPVRLCKGQVEKEELVRRFAGVEEYILGVDIRVDVTARVEVLKACYLVDRGSVNKFSLNYR